MYLSPYNFTYILNIFYHILNIYVTLYLFIYYQNVFPYKSEYIMVDVSKYKISYILEYINTHLFRFNIFQYIESGNHLYILQYIEIYYMNI